ncbi:MAG TPA: GNAT family N-acetyltransferase [Gaiellaceae bacterium]|nr:GNAT family N-acetyltransferase [Gaiellaceae bacterium]
MFERLWERLEGEIVVLEPLAKEHEAGLREAGADPEIWHWMTVHGHEPEVFTRWFEAALGAAAERREAPFALRLIETGELAGSTRYMSLRPEHRGLEIGYTWNTPATWGAGVNPEAKYLLLRHAFEELGCIRVEFKTDARNERARRGLEALPARFEGIFRSHMLVRDGERRDSAWYAITDGEWPAVRANLERRISARR